MRYTKRALEFSEQAKNLADHGLVGDSERVRQKLGSVNDYRLSAYWHPFRGADPSGWATRLDALIARYPSVPIADMGFPTSWRACPIWARML